VRAEQTVSAMVVESLTRQAQALSEGIDPAPWGGIRRDLQAPAGGKLAELADCPTAMRRPPTGKRA
jgi:hypothetical protein